MQSLRPGDDALSLGWISLSNISKVYAREVKENSNNTRSIDASQNEKIHLLDASVRLVPDLDIVCAGAMRIAKNEKKN
jgi:hypothetical protein